MAEKERRYQDDSKEFWETKNNQNVFEPVLSGLYEEEYGERVEDAVKTVLSPLKPTTSDDLLELWGQDGYLAEKLTETELREYAEIRRNVQKLKQKIDYQRVVDTTGEQLSESELEKRGAGETAFDLLDGTTS